MATSTITLCKTNITPSRNALIDDITTYIASLTTKTTISNFQYQRIELDKIIKVDLAQEWQAVLKYNYCIINQDNRNYYYFITKATQLAQNTIEFTLSIDSINTFRNDFTFSDKTNVIREHRSRFKSTDRFVVGQGTSYTLHRIVDNEDEGISPVKYKQTDYIINEDQLTARQNWYLIYKTEVADSGSPLEVYLIPKTSVKLNDVPETASLDLDNEYYYYVLKEEDPDFSFTFNGRSYSFGSSDIGMCLAYGSNTFYLSRWQKVSDSFENVVSDTTVSNPSSTIATITNCESLMHKLTTRTCDPDTIRLGATVEVLCGINDSITIDDIDRSDSTIVNIIELPYLPDNIVWTGGYIDLTNATNWEVQGRMLHLKEYTAEFEHKLKNDYPLPNVTLTDSATSLSDLKTQARSNKYESKMYNSSLYDMKFVYDSFSTSIAYERLDSSQTNHTVDLYFKPSNSLTSELGFKWELNSDSVYKYNQDYENFLISNRQNSLGLYNSDYLNYIRTGYNYDVKSKNRQTASSIVSSVTSIAGSLISLALSAPTGGISLVASTSFLSTAITTTSNAIMTSVNAEQELQKKLDEYASQSSSVNNASSVDLLNWYNSNKLHIVTYLPSTNVTKGIVDLFHYCGYATNKQKTPDMTSRYWFNFIQCEPVFEEESTSALYEEFMQDIKVRYQNGVTVYHHKDNTWNWNQDYENFETFLYTGL